MSVRIIAIQSPIPWWVLHDTLRKKVMAATHSISHDALLFALILISKRSASAEWCAEVEDISSVVQHKSG